MDRRTEAGEGDRALHRVPSARATAYSSVIVTEVMVTGSVGSSSGPPRALIASETSWPSTTLPNTL